MFKRKSGKGTLFKGIVCEHPKGMHGLPSNLPADIEYIKLEDVRMFKSTGIRKETFQKFKKLQILSISKTDAQSVDKDLLAPHRNTLMTTFIYDHGGITDLPIGLFQEAPLLWGIHVDTNSIIKISKGLFCDLQQLRWVNLRGNRIKLIEIGAFHNTPTLQWLKLHGNMLTYLDVNIIENFNIYRHHRTDFDNNRWFCNQDLCPFMNRAKPTVKCVEPMILKGKVFSDAINYVGTKVDQVRHTVDIGKSVEMTCSTCTITKLAWKKEGTETLPPGVSIAQAEGNQTSTLKISQVDEHHDGNYSCYNPECTAADCPKPIVAVNVILLEPRWNFTGDQGSIDEIVRYGDAGLFFALLPLGIYSILMVVFMAVYWIYKKIKKGREQQP